MMVRVGLVGLLAAWFLTGCSTHYYEGDSPRTASEVKSILGEVSSAQTSNVGTAMQAQASAVVYYGESTAKNIQSFLSVEYASLFGTVDATTINGGRVFLLDNISVDGSIGLVIGLDSGGNGYTYYGFSGTGEVKDDLFRAELTGATGTIVIESIDNDGSNLDDIIQLRVYVKNASGGERYVGKISTLFAYQ